jgi:hypothetical protein
MEESYPHGRGGLSLGRKRGPQCWLSFRHARQHARIEEDPRAACKGTWGRGCTGARSTSGTNPEARGQALHRKRVGGNFHTWGFRTQKLARHKTGPRPESDGSNWRQRQTTPQEPHVARSWRPLLSVEALKTGESCKAYKQCINFGGPYLLRLKTC